MLASLVAGSLILLAIGWVGLRAWQTWGHVSSAAGLARQFSTQLAGGDTAQARRTLDALQRQTAAGRSSSGDPAWRLAERTPYGGANLAAVQAVAETVDELSRRTFPRLLAIEPAALLPRSGRLDLQALGRAIPQLIEADDAVQRIRSSFRTAPGSELLGSVRDVVDQTHSSVDRLAALTSAARRATTVLPPMLGAKGDRSYLIAVQDLAEARATGGTFAVYVVLTISDGRLTITRHGAASDFSRLSKPLPLTPEMRGLYTDLPGSQVADVNRTPDFPTAAALYREMYRRHTGQTVDGVLAIDPVALSYLLRAVGPVTVEGSVQLGATTTVRSMLSDTYRRRATAKDQDAWFSTAAKATVDALITRPADPQALFGALNQATGERRLLFWSAHPDEQAAIAGTALAGELPDQEATPTVGVFLNDGSGAKLGYYLTHQARLTVGGCRADGRRELTLRVTLGSAAPRSGLTERVLGSGLAGNGYTARTFVSVFSPAGGTVEHVRIDGRNTAIGTGRERSRQVGIATVDLAPGQAHVLEVGLLTAPTLAGIAELRVTPGVNPWTTEINSAPPCER